MKVVAAGERSAPITLGGVARRAPAVVMVGQRGPAGAGGVAAFNGRLGSVTLTGADVTTALGYTPQDGGSLSAVAFSGDYADLLGAPAIPSTPADIGAATAAQGALAASAVQPDALDTALADKVDKVAGYGLSQESYTSAEKTKLAGLEGSHFKGLFASLAALELALPSAVAGDYADVDAGVGSDTVRYLWDVDDAQWVTSGSGSPLTAAEVKSLYESNPDTNAYTDAEQTKLGAIEAGAQVNAAAVSQAEADGSKFKKLLNSVINFLKAAVERLKGNNSEKYITDVDALRKYLAKALLAYAHRDGAAAVAKTEAPQFQPVEKAPRTTWYYSGLSKAIQSAPAKVFEQPLAEVGT